MVSSFHLLTVSMAFAMARPAESFQPVHSTCTARKWTAPLWGFFDRIQQTQQGVNDFFQDRKGDFAKLEDTLDVYGPGPVLVLYNVPAGVTNEEIQDMMQDGAPQASAKGVTLYRIEEDENEPNDVIVPTDPVLDQSMRKALEGMADGSFRDSYYSRPPEEFGSIPKAAPIVVTLFSGFSNSELLAAYNILGNEIYQEAQISPACAKAVPNAMEKPLRQVLQEIGGDHRDAMATLDSQGPAEGI